MKYLVNIDLNQNELQNAVVQPLATAPSSGKLGQIYYNSTDKKIYQYNGTAWIAIGITDVATTSANGLMSSSDKTKLNGIAAGAEVNQNAFSNVKVGSTTVAADAKTDTLELVAGSNVTLTPDATNDKVTIAATDTTYSAGTQALLETGTDTANRVWQPKILHDYISSTVGATDAMRFKGTIGTGGTVTSLPTSGVKIGDTYRVITAGTYAGQTCEIGDLIIATETTPAWTVAQTNIDGAITSISGTAPITVSGSGSSRTIAISAAGVTAGTYAGGWDSKNMFFYVPSFTVDDYGRITAASSTSTVLEKASSLNPGFISSSAYNKLSQGWMERIKNAGMWTIAAGQTSVSFAVTGTTLTLEGTQAQYLPVPAIVDAFDAITNERVMIDIAESYTTDADFVRRCNITCSIASAYENDINIRVMFSCSGM